MKFKYLKSKFLLTFSAILISAIITVSYLNITDSNSNSSINSEVSILFLGDFMIGDSYYGTTSKCFQYLKPMFENKNDIIVNLETSVTDIKTPISSYKSYTYKINKSVLEDVIKNNITILNLANNHVLDFGVEGLNDTILNIQNYNLSYFGAGHNETQARLGVVKSYNNSTKIGYLGYFEYRTSYDYNYHFYAKKNIPGIAELSTKNLESDISRIKNDADIVIVSLHIGENYEVDISKEHKDFARYAIDAGADAVICHSAHIILPVEIYKGKPIFYSVGNFIFTTPGRFRDVDELYHVGMGVEFIIKNKKITSLKLTPFKTNNRLTNYQPCFLNRSEIDLLFDMILPSDINKTLVDLSVILDFQDIGKKSYLIEK